MNNIVRFYQCTRCNKILKGSGHATRHTRTKFHFPLIDLGLSQYPKCNISDKPLECDYPIE